LTPGGRITVHIYTQIILRTTQSTKTIRRTTQFTNLEECGPCPRLCEVYPGICLTTEEKARENLGQGSRRGPVGTLNTQYRECVDPRVYLNILESKKSSPCQVSNRGCLSILASLYTDRPFATVYF